MVRSANSREKHWTVAFQVMKLRHSYTMIRGMRALVAWSPHVDSSTRQMFLQWAFEPPYSVLPIDRKEIMIDQLHTGELVDLADVGERNSTTEVEDMEGTDEAVRPPSSQDITSACDGPAASLHCSNSNSNSGKGHCRSTASPECDSLSSQSFSCCAGPHTRSKGTCYKFFSW